MARRCKYGRTRKGACRKRPYREPSSGLGGAKRTCMKFGCKPGRAPKPSKACPAGQVLRCVKYTPTAGRSPKAGQRKGYAQYIYGRALPGRTTVRETFPPSVGGKALPTSEQIGSRGAAAKATVPKSTAKTSDAGHGVIRRRKAA